MISIGSTAKGAFSIDPTKHFLLLGSSGVGKTTAATNIFIKHIRNGAGGLFMDYHGDAADFIATMIPKSRSRDFVWIDPDAPYVVSLNPLAYRDQPEMKLKKDTTYTTVKASAGDSWGAESGRVTISALDAVFEYYENPTLVHVARFLLEDALRKRLLDATQDPLLFLKDFQRQYDEKLRDSEQMSKFSPAINKFSRFLRPGILPMVGQEQAFDFLDAMNTKKIIVCRFSKGRLGEEDAQLLGSFVVNMLSIAALRREHQPENERPDFLAFLDEAQNAAFGGRIPSILTESRKYGLALGLGFQGLYQVPFVRDALSVPTQMVYNVTGTEADEVAKNWRYEFRPGVPFVPERITELPRYEFWARAFVANAPAVMKVQCYKRIKPRGDEIDRDTLIRQSMMRYGKNKVVVREKIASFLSKVA